MNGDGRQRTPSSEAPALAIPCEFQDKDRCTADEILEGVHELHSANRRLAAIVKTYYRDIVGVRASQKRIEARQEAMELQLTRIEAKLDLLLSRGNDHAG